MANKIVIPYEPRPIWRDVIHPALETHRFAVLVCHRRFGKTVGSINELIKKACLNKLRAPRYAYVAPYRNQAKQIAWSYLKYYTAVIPGIKVNESELYIQLPSMHENSEGARIYIIGADNPDSLRGAYWDGVILDEYAQIKPELWGEVIRPALSDRNGWAIFIGTPKGQNQFYDMYLRGIRENWFVCLHTAEETMLLPQAELDDMRKSMTEIEYRQEMMCDFTASAFNVLISIDLVARAVNTRYKKEDIAGSPKVLAVDVARFGDDRCTITRREGLVMYPQKIFRDINNMDFADQVAMEIRAFSPDAVFIDAGRGEGVIDRLRQLGYQNIIEVNFGGKATESNRYINKRVEMYHKAKAWLESGGNIPDDPGLRQELTVSEYSFDSAGRIKLESKDDIKEKLGRSPDLADGLVLTFASDIMPKSQYVNTSSTVAKTHDPFEYAFNY